MADVNQLLDLPLGTVAALASGYIGYRLAYVGKDGGHQQADTAFLTLVWASVAKFTTMQAAPIGVGAAYLLGLVATCVVALVWRKYLQELVFWCLRKASLLDHDGFHSAWASALGRPLEPPRQLIVRLKSGRRLACDDLNPFYGAPLGPCLLGPDGSVGLYVTAVMESHDGEWSERSPQNDCGWSMTYIAASEISEIEILRSA